MRHDPDPFVEIIERAMRQKPGSVTHVDIKHEETCAFRDGEPCDCNPRYTERRPN